MSSKYIYLVFTKTGTWLSKLISTVSQMKYAHSSISFDNSFTKMYSFGRVNPDNPFSGGFVVENLYEGVYKDSQCECLIYRIRVTVEQLFLLQEQVEKFQSEQDKYRYNFLGLFGILLNKPLIQRKNHYFCSQFVSEILLNSNVFHSERIPELIKTDELIAIENREVIYEGFTLKVSA
ncbi:hypothetical protein [Desulfitobacterium sp.]|uniref:hypothetical protein n=1 Tax=Desulfitobacterium sp. TaxID=49981 RepID=UPI002CD7DCE3|nr:hypothetical protein [Desulfitobacterium sp.]HVJ47817.1 hypothetical protein [Desulfitobacterium sp.]